MSASIERVLRVYEGSDGDATLALYKELEKLGPIGTVCINLFRAQKASERAKKYRGGSGGRSYRGMAYDKKQWSLDNLCKALIEHADKLGSWGSITWGWGRDEKTTAFEWVLYVDLGTGQASFHSPVRGTGPDYPAGWDGIPGRSSDRIVRFVARVLDGVAHKEIAA